jgi:hypothetical protein
MADTPYYAITLMPADFFISLPPLLICRHATLPPLRSRRFSFSCRHYCRCLILLSLTMFSFADIRLQLISRY